VVKEKAIRRGECIQSRDYEMFHLDAFLQLGKFRALVTTNGIRAWAFSSDSGYLLSHSRLRPRLGLRADNTSEFSEHGMECRGTVLAQKK
jgi:hypothetical protein